MISYEYDIDGMRTGKTVNGVKTEYILDNGTIVAERKAGNQILYYFDESGNRFGFRYNNADYYYIFNLQGDVIGILNSAGTQIVSYEYDNWGKVLSVTGTQAETIGQINPIRYRGYYYDSESGLYYLNSRYYDPETGRFVNADEVLNKVGEIKGYNLFEYCFNNPIKFSDPTGYIALIDDAIFLASGFILLGSFMLTTLFSYFPVASPPMELPLIPTTFETVLLLPSIMLAAEHTKRNGSKKKTNDKHTKPRPGRESEKKKQKPGWKKRNPAIVIGEKNYNEKTTYVPDGQVICTNPFHDACIGYHPLII